MMLLCLQLVVRLVVVGALGAATASSCGFPGRPAYGRVSLMKDSYDVNQTVMYFCDNGFNLLGQYSRTCQEDGNWSGTLPICDTSLSVQNIPETSGYLYAYPPTHALDGSKLTCFYSTQQKARWWRLDLSETYHVLSVAITIPHANSYQRLTVSVINNLNGKAVFSRCASFSGKFSSQTLLLMCAEGKGISGQYIDIMDNRPEYDYFSLCEVEVFVLRDKYPCGDPERAPKSYTVPQTTHKMEYRCLAGYKLSGPSVRNCLPSGQWSGEPPVCLEIACPSLGPLPNGHIHLRSSGNGRMIQGSKAIYTCDSGYILHGNDTRTCLDEGRWGGSQPVCQPIDCGIPSYENSNGILTLLNVSTTFGSMAELVCKLGFERSGGPGIIYCQEDGTWGKVEASCVTAGTVKQTLKEEPLIHKEAEETAENGVGVKHGLIAGIVAVAFLMLVCICILLLLKRRRHFNKQTAASLPTKENDAALSNNGNSISYTQSSGSIYQSDSCYMEIPIKSPTNGWVHQDNNKNHNDSKKSLSSSRKSSISSRENIYEEITLGLKKKLVKNRSANKKVLTSTPKKQEKKEQEKQLTSTSSPATPPSDALAVYASVDFAQKRKSRFLKDQTDGSSPESDHQTDMAVKLRDLPPIPPEDEDEERGGSVAMSLEGAVTPLNSIAPYVLMDNNIFVDHPLVTEDIKNNLMVDNNLYSSV